MNSVRNLHDSLLCDFSLDNAGGSWALVNEKCRSDGCRARETDTVNSWLLILSTKDVKRDYPDDLLATQTS